MRQVTGLIGVLLLSMSCALSAAEFTPTEIMQMHQAGVKMKLSNDADSVSSYVVPANTSPQALINAESLDFANLAIFNLPPWLGKFTNLRRLDLSNTQIEMAGLQAALANMPKLDVLNVSGNKTLFSNSSNSLNALWPLLKNLSDLDLSNLSATPQQLGNLAPLSQLNRLTLSQNKLGENVVGLGLKQLSALRVLSMSDAGVNSAPLDALPVGSLRALDLSNNSISTLPFVNMPALETLNVGGNSRIKISKAYGGLFVMPALKQLKVDDNVSLPKALKQKFERMRLAALAPLYAPHAKRYQVHSNGTVTDRTTGLMWKQCSEGQSGSACQQGAATSYNWQDALALKGSQFAGYSDWRVPTIEELRELVFCSNGTPAKEAWDNDCDGKNDRNGSYERPTINQTVFPNTRSSWYWSSSPYAYSGHAWSVSFRNGYDDTYTKGYDLYVRLVRSGQ